MKVRLVTPGHVTFAWIAAAASMSCAPARAEPGDGFDVVRYELAITPDLQKRSVTGRQRIILRAAESPLRQLDFTANALRIEKALLDGAPVVIEQRPDVLRFSPSAPLKPGQRVALDLIFEGQPARGLVWTDTMLYSSYFACDWMICVQNGFGDKADFKLDLTVPAGMASLSVGELVGKHSAPAGNEIHSWRTQRPYSSYLYGFAIGSFSQAKQKAGGAQLTYISDTASPSDLKAHFAATPAMVAFLSRKAGMALPVANYTQLLVAGSEAQEAATYSVMGLDVLPQDRSDPAEDWAIVHELAHQWWGNLVTCATLKDFWLNEGITTFMTAAWKEHRYGRAAYTAELEVAEARLAKARELGFDKPLAWGGRYPSLTVRRAVQYSKGALFMAHLRQTIGEDAFWSGLRHYTRTHAGGTVTSIDLQRAMERSSGRDLAPQFDKWVFGA